MAGTRTAPLVTAAAVYQLVTLGWIDVSGDKRADSYRFPIAATPAEIETWVAAMVAGSNASLYYVDIAEERSGTADASNAETGVKSDSVNAHLYFTAKSDDLDVKTKRMSFPAPEALLFVADGDTLDPASAEIIAALAAFLVCLGAGWNIIHGTYTERTEINEKVPI